MTARVLDGESPTKPEDDLTENRARICVPVCARRAGELKAAVERAAAQADLVELRLDCLDASELEAARPVLAALLAAPPRPLVLTLRPAEQGGLRDLDERERLAFRLDSWPREGGTRPPVFFDIELDLMPTRDEAGEPRPATDERGSTPDADDGELRASGDQRRAFAEWVARHGRRVICSHHDFAGVPPNLEEIYERMAATPARVLKIAYAAQTATDCLPALALLARARREERELIAVAMGDAGLLTRVLAPSRGAFLTFGAADAGQATAPGQITAAELRELYRLDSIDEQTQITGLVGSPVTHSLSPHIHNAAFAALGLNAVYLPLEVRDLDAFVRRLARPQTRELDWPLRGLSVTAPHKRAVLAHLDWVDPAARAVGAVNTVVLEGDRLRGYNTDAAAALKPLEGAGDLRGARVALIGAGGAARAVLWALRERGARPVVFARDESRARATAEGFGADAAALGGARFGEFDVVVNATPLGTRGHAEEETAATAEQLRGARVVYDLVYNPAETRLMREARAAGCEAYGGLGMLVAQAAEQCHLWTGRAAPLEVMRAAAERKMAGG